MSSFSQLSKALSVFFAAHGKTLSSFSAMQGMQLLLPLLALPLLARRLGPDAFGLLMYFCLLPPMAALLVDWGLSLGGARNSAKVRGNDAALSHILASALGSKLLLLGAAALIAIFFMPILPYAAQFPGAYALAIGAGMARGLNPAWFFQGSAKNVQLIAFLDVTASCAVLILVWLYIHKPDSWPLYLFFLAICKSLAYGASFTYLCRQYGFGISLRGAVALIRQCAPLCAFSFSLLFCYNGSQISLGFFLSPVDLGILGAVNKMIRALGSLITPFTMTLFPEICLWRHNNPDKARRALRLSFGLTALGASCAAAMAALAAPWLIAIAMGPGYAAAIPALRLGLMAIPAMACNNVLGQQALIPFDKDKNLLAVQAITAALCLPLAAILGHFQGLLGGAMLPACVEFTMLIGLGVAVTVKCPQAFWQDTVGKSKFSDKKRNRIR